MSSWQSHRPGNHWSLYMITLLSNHIFLMLELLKEFSDNERIPRQPIVLNVYHVLGHSRKVRNNVPPFCYRIFSKPFSNIVDTAFQLLQNRNYLNLVLWTILHWNDDLCFIRPCGYLISVLLMKDIAGWSHVDYLHLAL